MKELRKKLWKLEDSLEEIEEEVDFKLGFMFKEGFKLLGFLYLDGVVESFLGGFDFDEVDVEEIGEEVVN